MFAIRHLFSCSCGRAGRIGGRAAGHAEGGRQHRTLGDQVDGVAHGGQQ